MKKAVVLFIGCLLSVVVCIAQTEVLTNESVISLCKSGLSSSVIITKIKKSKTNFKTETADLISLKQQKVPDEVVNAMVEATDTKGADVTDLTNPNEHQKSGIYFFDANKKLEAIDASLTTQGVSGVTGYAKYGASVKLDNANARIQTSVTKPVFYFYFDKTGVVNYDYQYCFTSTTTASEFLLVKFTTNGKVRGIETMSSSAYGGTRQGVPDKQIIPFDIEKIADGIYKVTPKTDLMPGEYCFMHSNSAQRAYIGVRAYDFGVGVDK